MDGIGKAWLITIFRKWIERLVKYIDISNEYMELSIKNTEVASSLNRQFLRYQRVHGTPYIIGVAKSLESLAISSNK
jgi:hypothetical protein